MLFSYGNFQILRRGGLTGGRGRLWLQGTPRFARDGQVFFVGEKTREIQVEEMNTWKHVDMIWHAMIWYDTWYDTWYDRWYDTWYDRWWYAKFGLEKEPFDAWDLERILWSSPPVSPVAPRTSEDLFDDKNGHLMGTMMDQQMEYDGFCLFPPSFSDNQDLHDLHGRSTVVDPWGYNLNYEIIWIYNTYTLW